MRMPLPNDGFIDVSGLVFDTPEEQMLRQIEAHINQGGWDAKPSWYGVFMKEGMGLFLMSIDWLPEPLYENPAEYLPGFSEWLESKLSDSDAAAEMKLIFQSLISDSFVGLVTFVEAWSVKMPKNSVPEGTPPEQVEQYMRQYLGGRTPSQHAERVEVRVGVMSKTDGSIAMIIRERNETPHYAAYAPDDKDYAYASFGRLSESLGAFVKQVQHMGSSA